MSYFFSRIRRVKLNDYLQVWKLLVCIIPALVYKATHSEFWLVSEAPGEARDNGYWFFQYLRKEHPEQSCYYVINKTSPDYEKVRKLGPVIERGSLKHWVLYLAADKIISSQKAMGPNAAICGFLEVYGFLKNHRYFLQHGVIINDLKFLYCDVTKFDLFICGAYPEYRYVSENYGYPPGIVQYTGLCRFDGLHDVTEPERLVVIMPTWREWIADEDERLLKTEGTTVIKDSEYFKTWSLFIQDEKLNELAVQYNVKFIFFPHREMQKYLEFFPKSSQHVTVAGAGEFEVQELLKKASLLITDYSSVFFDVLYMKKPVLFYQFDYDKFRKGQYGEGYFDYRNNPFGKSFVDRQSVFEELEYYLKNDFQVDEAYRKAHKDYFRLYDDNNCKRVYDAIMK